MIHIYDHRSAHVTVDAENLHNPAFSSLLTSTEKQRFDAYPTPQYWIAESDIQEEERRTWCLGFRDIARATDVRTMIASAIPSTSAGNKLPLLLPGLGHDDAYKAFAPLLLANLNALALDFVVRQKVQSTSMNWYIVEQLPLIRREQFEQTLARITIADFIRGEVLRLVFTAHDLQPFARDLGYDGPPFLWDEQDRRHRIARLDALFFLLYGLTRDDAAYMLDTFTIAREQDVQDFGKYLTKELVLGYMNALSAEDTQTVLPG